MLEWLTQNQGTNELRKEWRKKIKSAQPFLSMEDDHTMAYMNKYIVQRKRYVFVSRIFGFMSILVFYEFIMSYFIYKNDNNFWENTILYKMFNESILINQLRRKNIQKPLKE